MRLKYLEIGIVIFYPPATIWYSCLVLLFPEAVILGPETVEVCALP